VQKPLGQYICGGTVVSALAWIHDEMKVRREVRIALHLFRCCLRTSSLVAQNRRFIDVAFTGAPGISLMSWAQVRYFAAALGC
jgi:hypothetical protein